MDDLKNVALIGVSGYGAQHLNVLRQLHDAGQVRLAAAVVINPLDVPDELAYLKSIGCRVYADSAAMYRTERPDLVAIPTGIGSHEALTVEALRHGGSVLVEKPAAATLDAVDRMLAAERAAIPAFVAVGFQHLYDAGIQALKRQLLAGRLGVLRQVVVTGIAPRPDGYYRRNAWAGHLVDASGRAVNDSPVNNAFAHYLNLGLFFAGGAMAECAALHIDRAELYRARAIESFDSAFFEGELSCGARLHGFFSHTIAVENPQLEVRVDGRLGSLVWAAPHQWRWLDSAGGIIEEGGSELDHSAMFRAVIRHLDDATEPVCSLRMARSHGACIEQLHRKFPIRTVPLAEQLIRDDFRHTPGLAKRFRSRFQELTGCARELQPVLT